MGQAYNTGTIWNDTDGKPINAHGGGILYHQGSYYWYGEFKGQGKVGNVAMDGVSCYSSRDLKNWKNEGLALRMINDSTSPLQPGCLIERPKVIYNHKTKKYVMWFHHELKGKGYAAAMAGVAVADRPKGPFTYIKSVRPNPHAWPTNFPDSLKRPLTPGETLDRKDKNFGAKRAAGYLVRRDFESGQMSRDMTLYVDDDGTAYQITASEDNSTLHVNKLAIDYLGFTGEYYRVQPGGSNEAPALIKHGGKYYLITSGTTGWSPNPARSFVADKITGPYESLGNPAVGNDEDKATTFHSQGTFILPIEGKRETYIFMADRWVPNNAIDGTYVWLPLTIENGKPVIRMKE
ncbi:glycoside hydrolase family 43 protein [Flavisolibacter ginsenosidimutans]